MFGPEYRVTLSREGRNLSRQQGALAEAGVHSNKKMRMLSRELEKAESEQENGGVADEGDAGSGTENSARDAIQNSAAGFMKSSLNRERSVDELADMVGDFGRGFLLKANDIAQNLLKKGASVKEAVGDKSFTDGEIDELMQNYRSEVKEKTEEADIYGNLGTQIVRYMRDVKLQRIADNPLQNMQRTKDGMMQAASAAALAKARNSSLDETSGKLADEVEELIDRRNHVGRISQDGGEDGEEQTELIQPKEQESGK